MEHIKYVKFSEIEFYALQRMMETIWTAGALDLNLLCKENVDEQTKKRAQQRLADALTIPMGISAWLAPHTLNPNHFRYKDFKQAFDSIADRLQKYGVDVEAILREAANTSNSKK